MPAVGKAVREIRVREQSGAYRVLYITMIGNNVYVLHAFSKKTQKTAQRDVALARTRLKDISQDR